VERQIDAANESVVPVIEDDRTLVPVRFISESLGAAVAWDGKTGTIGISLADRKVSMKLGSKTLTANGKEMQMDVPARSTNDRTLIPLRSIVEALGKKVFYDRGLIIIGNNDSLFDRAKERGLIDGIIARVNVLPAVGLYRMDNYILNILFTKAAWHNTTSVTLDCITHYILYVIDSGRLLSDTIVNQTAFLCFLFSSLIYRLSNPVKSSSKCS
jgi:hypothetical protein